MVTTKERAPAPEQPVRTVAGERAGATPVVVGLDGSELAERALPYAVRIAHERGAPLILVRAVDLYPHGMAGLSAAAVGDVLWPIERDEANDYLAKQVQRLRELLPGLQVQAELRVGEPAQELLDAERENDAQLLVLTTHGRTGISRWLRGSVAEKVLRYGLAAVLMVRPWDSPPAAAAWTADNAPTRRRVVVGLDGSEMAERVLPAASRIAGGDAVHIEAQGGPGTASQPELVLTMVVPPRTVAGGHTAHGSLAEARDAAHAYLEGTAVHLRRGGVVAWPVVLVAEDVAGAIADLAINVQADLIALSTHGRGGLGRWIYGSVTDRVAHVARVPVLLFRPPATGLGTAARPAVAAAAHVAQGAH